MSDSQQTITEDQWHRAARIWEYHQLHHQPRPVDVAIGLGSHDLGVATHSAGLYRAGLFPTLVFTGGNSPTTVGVFPRGEAVHFREHALGLGVPAEAILLEPNAGNTGQNITLSREVLAAAGITPATVMLVGDLQRVIEYPKLGFAIEQDVPKDVRDAYESLVQDGFTSRLIAP